MIKMYFHEACVVFTDKAIYREEDGSASAVKSSRQEYHLVAFLAAAEGAVCKREALFQAVWQDQPVAPNNLNNLIYGLRTKLKCWECDFLIDTVPREGYRLHPDVVRTEIIDAPGKTVELPEIDQPVAMKEEAVTPVDPIVAVPVEKGNGWRSGKHFIHYFKIRWLVAGLFVGLLFGGGWFWFYKIPLAPTPEVQQFREGRMQVVYVDLPSAFKTRLLAESARLKRLVQDTPGDVLLYFDFSVSQSFLTSCVSRNNGQVLVMNVVASREGDFEQSLEGSVKYCLKSLAETRHLAKHASQQEGNVREGQQRTVYLDNKGEVSYSRLNAYEYHGGKAINSRVIFDGNDEVVAETTCVVEMVVEGKQIKLRCKEGGMIANSYDKKRSYSWVRGYGESLLLYGAPLEWAYYRIMYRDRHILCLDDLMGCQHMDNAW